MKLDDHYTPSDLARIAVSHVRLRCPEIVADMSAGEGSLLLEAARRWPMARIVATDIDRKTVDQHVRLRRRRWKVGRCDFLVGRSRSACRVLREIDGKVGLLLINPPFSCRGGSYQIVHTTQGPIRTSLAMAFLLLGLPYLAARGEVVAILPAGSLHNKKDEAAWHHVRERFAVRELARWDKNAFPGCAASSVLVKLTPFGRLRRALALEGRERKPSFPKPRAYASIVRGTCPIHQIPDNATGPTLVHYTDLREASVVLNGHRGFGAHRCLKGPAVLIPRVGRITPGKVSVFPSARRVMISDCVIGLKTRSLRSAQHVRKLLVDNFRLLAAAYVGTGAPHITLERLRNALLRLGVGEGA
jgi:hypothetical protein